MISSTHRTPMRRPLFPRFLAIACFILFIPLTIAVLIVIGLIPVYLTNRAVEITRSTVAPPFNVTYLVVDPSTSVIDLNSIDRMKTARSFELGLDLPVRNVLQIHDISPNTAVGQNSSSRRKRFIQCDRNLSGPALIFNFSLTYPSNRICQSQQCVNDTFEQIYQQFQTVLSLTVDFNNIQTELRLCSFNPTFYAVPSSASKTPKSSSTSSSSQKSTTSTSVSNSNRPTTTASSTVTFEKNVSSSTIDNFSTRTSAGHDSTTKDNFSTQTLARNNSTMTTGISSTATVTSSAGMISSTESSNFTSNKTDVSGLNACLKKIPITQESVAPYRINSTSTLFFQDNHSLIVVGASKFETSMNLGTITRSIIIDGVLVYKNCQRTFELSLPIVCHCPISS